MIFMIFPLIKILFTQKWISLSQGRYEEGLKTEIDNATKSKAATNQPSKTVLSLVLSDVQPLRLICHAEFLLRWKHCNEAKWMGSLNLLNRCCKQWRYWQNFFFFRAIFRFTTGCVWHLTKGQHSFWGVQQTSEAKLLVIKNVYVQPSSISCLRCKNLMMLCDFSPYSNSL